MNLQNILNEKTIEELKEFARVNNIKGYSGLKKEQIVQLILTALENDDQLKEIFNYIPPSARYLLGLLVVKFNGKCGDEEIKPKLFEKYSKRTIRNTLGELLNSPFFYLEIGSKEDEIYSIPQDILPKIKDMAEKYYTRHVSDIETESDQNSGDAGEIQTEEVNDIQAILDIANKEMLSFYCEEQGCAKSGNKTQLIERILKLEKPRWEILTDVLGSPELKMVARDLGLKVSGNKEDIAKRITEKFGESIPASSEPKPTPPKINKEKPIEADPAVMAKINSVIIEPVSNEPTVIKSTTPDLKDQIEDLLDELYRAKFPHPRDEKDFQMYLLGFLGGKFGTRKVAFERVGQGQRFDITLWNKVIIETKSTGSKKDVQNGLGQIIDYLEKNQDYKYGILAVNDESSARNLVSQFNPTYSGGKIFMIFY